MAQNRVEIDINANDNATGAINRVVGNFSRLNNSVSTGNASLASFMGNLGAGLVFKGLDIAIGKVGQIKSGLLEASKIQAQQVMTANTTALALKVSLPEGEAIAESLMSKLSKAAAAQPGDTEDYLKVFNGLNGAVARAVGGDKEEYERSVIELSRTAGLLATSAGVSVEEAGLSVGRLIDGTLSLSEARQLDLFTKNPELLSKFKDLAVAKGLDPEDIKTWAKKDLLQTAEEALGAIASPELLARLNSTAESKLASIQTALFNPREGVFGFLRKIEPLGGKTILDAFSNFLDSFSTLGQIANKVATKLGISFDPLAVLGRLTDWLSNTMDNLSRLITKFDPSNFKGVDLSFGGIFKIFSNLNAFDLGAKVSEMYGQYMEYLYKALFTVDWVKVGQTIAQVFLKAGDFVMGMILRFDFKSFARLMFTVVAAILAVVAGIVTEILYTVFKDIGRSVKNAFQYIIEAITGAVDSIKQAFQQLIDGVKNLLSSIPNPGQAVSGAVDGAKAFVGQGWDYLTGNSNKPMTTAKLSPRNGKLPTNKPKEEKSVLPPFSPIINVSPSEGMDENSLAKKVVSYLNTAYTDYNQVALT